MTMKHISTHIKSAMSANRQTERRRAYEIFLRGGLISGRLRDGLPPITMGRMGKTLEKIPTKDLYYLKSVCDKAEILVRSLVSTQPEKYEKANEKKSWLN